MFPDALTPECPYCFADRCREARQVPDDESWRRKRVANLRACLGCSADTVWRSAS